MMRSALVLVAAATLAFADKGSLVCTHLCGPVCSDTTSTTCMSLCTARCIEAKNTHNTRPGLLSPFITFNGAIQHVGLTTSNLSRSVAFYVDVMGGVEVQGAGGDGWDGDDVYQLLMQAAIVRGGDALSWAADLRMGGADTMSARYVAFDSVLVELLDYRSKEAILQHALSANSAATFPAGPAAALAQRAFPAFSPSTVAPSVAGNMHISFNVNPEKDLNDFVVALEATAHARGYQDVFCNRLVPVQAGPDGRPNVSDVPKEDNSYAVTEGTFEGWSLAYCKGPDGEQLEFNKVTGNATKLFDQALRTYLEGGINPKWR